MEAVKTTLREITGDIARLKMELDAVFSDPDMSECERDAAAAEALAQIQSNTEAMDGKLENIKFVIRDLEGQIAQRKQFMGELQDANRADEGRIEWLKRYALQCLQTVTGAKVKTALITARIGTSESVQVSDEQMLPTPKDRPDLYTPQVIVPPKLKLNEVKAAIKAGETISGVELVRRQYAVLQ
jgi:hypothetical protein